jgi:thymidylate synthase (FAD)
MGLNQIKAELIDHMGSDLRAVNSARVSFAKESEWEGEEPVYDHDGDLMVASTLRLSDKDTKLIKYLAKHDHFTPFTHCVITLRETVPIFVARQRFKHTVGFTYNEISRRYVDDTPEFFLPDEWRERPDGSVKQGSSNTAVVTTMDSWAGINGDNSVNRYYEMLNTNALSAYQNLLDAGVAPEMARMVLPQSMMTSYYVTGSLMAFARAYKLRSDTHSQLEIQHLAKHWDEIIRPLFPVSWAALVDAEEV